MASNRPVTTCHDWVSVFIGYTEEPHAGITGRINARQKKGRPGVRRDGPELERRRAQPWLGAPTATGRTGEPEWPRERNGRMIVHDVQTLSAASAARFAFWMLCIPDWVRFS